MCDPPLNNLVLAEAEFETDEQTCAFRPPLEPIAEVTDDRRFTGGSLVQTDRHDLLTCTWVADYGIKPEPQK